MVKRLNERLIGILEAGVLADDGNGHLAFRRVNTVANLFPGIQTRLRGRLDPKGRQHFLVETFLMVGHRHVVDVGNVERLNHRRRTHVAEQRQLAAFRFRNFAIGANEQDIGMNTERLKFLDRMLGRLGLQFTRCRNVGHQRQVHIDGRAARQVIAQLADRLHEGHGFNVADRAADFADHEIEIVIAFDNEVFDFISNVRNDLNGGAQIVATTFLVDDVLVNPPGGDVIGLGCGTPGKAFVVAKVEISLGTVIRHKHFTVLCRAHGAGIYVQIGVEFAQPHPITTGLQERSESRGRNSFSEGRNHAACDEYISRHGSHRITLKYRFRQPKNSLHEFRPQETGQKKTGRVDLPVDEKRRNRSVAGRNALVVLRRGGRSRRGCRGLSARCRRRRCGGLVRAQRVENALAIALRRRNTVENVGRLCFVARQNAKTQRRDEEQRRQNARGARQSIGRAARRHEAGTAADAEAAAFRTLDQHDADERDDDHEVNDDQYGLHETTCPAPQGSPSRGVGGSFT